MCDAIVLAGGEKKDARTGESLDEALLEINGKPMVSLVVEALAASAFVRRVYVVGPIARLKRLAFPDNVELLQSGLNLMDTIASGLQGVKSPGKVLISTVDLPFLSAEAIDDFLTRCRVVDADLYYPVISQEDMAARFPDARRTYVKLREGVFTGGNLFLVDPAIVPKCMTVARRVVANRKKPWRLASLLGWATLLRFVLRRLSLEGARARLSDILGIRGRVIRSTYPEIGMDVDKMDDLKLARTYLNRRD